MHLILVERLRTLEKIVNNCFINKESHIETATPLSTNINEKVISFPNSCKTTSNIVPGCIYSEQKEECQGLNQTLGEEQRQDKLRYGLIVLYKIR